MTKTTELEERIEQMVAAEIAALRRAAQGAVERAFAAGSAAAPTVAPSRRQLVRAPGKRRAGSELSALGERFLEVLIQRPGETMVVLSAEIGATPRELHRAVARLRAGGCGPSASALRCGTSRFRRALRAESSDRGSGTEQRRRRTGARGRAAGGQEGEHVALLLTRGVGDSHQVFGEDVAAVTLSPERAFAPKHEGADLAL